MLEHLDDIDWAALDHAYGTAEDVPDLLRDLGSDEEDEADEALEELTGSLFHQGTVYPATVPAVRFLVELALTAPHQRGVLIATVGMLADPYHAHGDEFPAVRAEVAAHAGRLLPFLDDPDPEVRAVAAYTMAQSGTGDLAAVRRRWATETEVEVRGSLLLALGVGDPAGSAGLLRSAVLDAPHPVRVAATLAIHRSAGEWPSGAPAAIAEAVAAGTEAEVHYVWQHDGEPLDELVAGVDDTFADDLLRRLSTAPGAAARRAALWALGERCVARRSAPERLVGLLGPALADGDPGVRSEAVGALRRIGVAAARFADTLAGLCLRLPEGVAITPESKALETLALLGDPRWVPAACAGWAEGRQVRLPHRVPARPEVLAAVRHHLAQYTVAGGPEAAITGLVSVLGGWGPAAAEATGDLLAAVPYATEPAVRTLAGLQAGTTDIEPELRSTAAGGAVGAGVEVYRLTGDPAPLLAAIEWQLTGPGRNADLELARAAAAVTAGLVPGPAYRPVLDRLRTRLTGQAAESYPERKVQVAAAHLVWLATGDAADVLPTVTAVLAGGDLPARSAAELAASLADPALEPLLRELLADEWARVGAIRALWRLGVPVAELAPLLVAVIEGDLGAGSAIPLLVEMKAADAVPELTRLAERDERLPFTGVADELVWADEQLRDELRRAVTALS